MGMILVWVLILLMLLAVPACLVFVIFKFIRRND